MTLDRFRGGAAQHYEDYAQSDFWVTRNRAFESLYKLVPTYVNAESVMDTDVVIWHMSPVHHEPRDEDGYIDSRGIWRGVALLMWSGIDLRPRNLFDSTPLFP